MAKSAAVRMAFTCVLLTYAVLRELPFTWIVDVGTKPVPTTEIVVEGAPEKNEDGVSEVIAGEGLSISKLTAAPLALVLFPFNTTIGRLPPDSNWLAGTDAVSCVELP